jgi:hypothetical protein
MLGGEHLLELVAGRRGSRRRAICEHAGRSSSERSSSSFFYPIGFLRDFDAIFASAGINIHDGPVRPVRRNRRALCQHRRAGN